MKGFDVNRFVQERTPIWTRLEQLLLELEQRGLSTLDLSTAREFGKLYRTVSSDLIRAQTELVDATVVDYLNDIVARSYALIHTATERRQLGIISFFTRGFPRLFRREWRVITISALIFFAGSLIGAGAVAFDPHSLGALIPDQHQARTPSERVDREERKSVMELNDMAAAISSWYFTHNIAVTFTVFVLGITFGIGTVAVLFGNGVPLGALAVQYHQSGQGLFFWAWILPHGIPEITQVAIAGGAGLLLARGLWLPGRLRRGDAVLREARSAVQLIIGGMPILILAGLIEGTISQVHQPAIPYPAKLLFAALTAAGVFTYLLRSGRTPD